jgi:hypothetical protein
MPHREPPARRRLSRFIWLVLCPLLATGGACSASSSSEPSIPEIVLVDSTEPGERATIQVRGLPKSTLNSLKGQAISANPAFLRVEVFPSDDAAGVKGNLPPVAGSYSVTDDALVFTPMFGFDRGLSYRVTFEPAHLAWTAPPEKKRLTAKVGLPKSDAAPTTSVDRIYPSSEVVPENLLRVYIHFTAPMGRKGGLGYLKLLDREGKEVEGAFLPLDTEFWNGDRTRFTAFLDPGRVKRGLLPNRQVGRSLELGHTYTLVVSREWPDAQGLPLKADYRHALRSGPADEKPLEPTSRWRLHVPKVGSTDPLTVALPEPLDHGLLMRAVGVETAAGAQLAGSSHVEAGETRWVFSPSSPWPAGEYRLVVLSILEDPSGNQIGRAFEVDEFERVDSSPAPERLTLPFSVR